MEQNEMELNGSEPNGTEWNRMRQGITVDKKIMRQGIMWNIDVWKDAF